MAEPFTKEAVLAAPALLALQVRSVVDCAVQAQLDKPPEPEARATMDSDEAPQTPKRTGSGDDDAGMDTGDDDGLVHTTPQPPESFRSIDKISAALQEGLKGAVEAPAATKSDSATEASSDVAPMLGLHPQVSSAFNRDPLQRKTLASGPLPESATAAGDAAGDAAGSAAAPAAPRSATQPPAAQHDAHMEGDGVAGAKSVEDTPRGTGLRGALSAAKLQWPPLPTGCGCRSVHLDVHAARQAMARAFVATRSQSDAHQIFITLRNDAASRLPLARSANSSMLSRFRGPGQSTRAVPGTPAPVSSPPPPGLQKLVALPSMGSTLTGAPSLANSMISLGGSVGAVPGAAAVQAGLLPPQSQALVTSASPAADMVQTAALEADGLQPGAQQGDPLPSARDGTASTATAAVTLASAEEAAAQDASHAAASAADPAPDAVGRTFPGAEVQAAPDAALSETQQAQEVKLEPAASPQTQAPVVVAEAEPGSSTAAPAAAPHAAAADIPSITADAAGAFAAGGVAAAAGKAPGAILLRRPPSSDALQSRPQSSEAPCMQPVSLAGVSPHPEVRELAMQVLAVPEEPQKRPPVPRKASHIALPPGAQGTSAAAAVRPKREPAIAPLLGRAPMLLADVMAVVPSAPSWTAPRRQGVAARLVHNDAGSQAGAHGALARTDVECKVAQAEGASGDEKVPMEVDGPEQGECVGAECGREAKATV